MSNDPNYKTNSRLKYHSSFHHTISESAAYLNLPSMIACLATVTSLWPHVSLLSVGVSTREHRCWKKLSAASCPQTAIFLKTFLLEGLVFEGLCAGTCTSTLNHMLNWIFLNQCLCCEITVLQDISAFTGCHHSIP